MLEYERTVRAPEGEAAVSVFVDSEKGHTVYLSHTGQIAVAECEPKGGRVRAAGFAVSGD